MHTLTLDQLQAAHAAGEVTAVTLHADGAEFEVHIGTAAGPRILAARFRAPRDASLLLLSVGITDLQVGSGAEHRKIRAALDAHQDGSNPSFSPDQWEQIRARKKVQRDASSW